MARSGVPLAPQVSPSHESTGVFNNILMIGGVFNLAARRRLLLTELCPADLHLLHWRGSSALLRSRPPALPLKTFFPLSAVAPDRDACRGAAGRAGKRWGELTEPPGTSFLSDDELHKLSALLNFVRGQKGFAALEFLLHFDLLLL